MEYTARILQSEGWWIGWIKEVRGVTCQERTREGLLETLKITLQEVLAENFPNIFETDTDDEYDYEEVKINL